MAGEVGGSGRGQVSRIESFGRAVTPEDVWNAAVRAGADPASMALSLCHVLGEVTLAEMEAGAEDDPSRSGSPSRAAKCSSTTPRTTTRSATCGASDAGPDGWKATMNPVARLLLAVSLALGAPLAAVGDEKAPNASAPLVTSDLSADRAAVRGAEVVRAFAASEPAISDRHAAHLSTRSGNISGGGIVTWASCKQTFSASEVLAGGGKAGDRVVEYSFIESARGGSPSRKRERRFSRARSAGKG